VIGLDENAAEINGRDLDSAVHNGLVAGSSPAGPTSGLREPSSWQSDRRTSTRLTAVATSELDSRLIMRHRCFKEYRAQERSYAVVRKALPSRCGGTEAMRMAVKRWVHSWVQCKITILKVTPIQ
jgi:hypothetical protein